MNKKEMEEISPTLLKGRITELKCELWFLEHGYLVSSPDLPYQYDFLVDIGESIIKIQVKTCRLDSEKSKIVFNTTSTTHNQQGYTKRTYSKNKVDYFMTEYNNNFYLIPFEEVGAGEKSLRLVPTKNGQVKGIAWASDFLIEKILKQEEVVE